MTTVRISSLVEEERTYREKYGVDTPSGVDAVEQGDYHSMEEIWRDLGDWKTVRRELRIIDRARRDRDAVDGAGIVG